MTYALAWLWQDHAYLVADTLRTTDRPSDLERTSVNESHCQVGAGVHVEESALKLLELRPGTACAIAGDSDLAFRIFEFLAEHITLVDVGELFDAVATSLGPFPPERAVQLLLADAQPNARASVARWTSTTAAFEQGERVYDVGSLAPEHRALSARMLGGLDAIAREPFTLLPAVIACVQSYGVHDDLLRQHVGGIVCGLRVHAGATFWQDDTLTVFYDDRLRTDATTDGLVSTHFRDGMLIVKSGYRPEWGAILTVRHSDPKGIEAAKEWGKANVAFLKQAEMSHAPTCRNWIFLHRTRRLATAVHIAPGGVPRMLFTVEATKGTVSVGFTPDFAARLIRPTEAGENGLDLKAFYVFPT